MNRARRTLRSGTNSVFETSLPKLTVETRLVQAYVMLLVVPKDEHDFKSVSVIRHGAYEVRLFEPRSASNTFVFWIELFDHDSQVSIDGGGANDLERALATAEYFASCAEKLSRERLANRS
jgi:hypothetical protein